MCLFIIIESILQLEPYTTMAQLNNFNNDDQGFLPWNMAGNANENGYIPLVIEAQEVELRNEQVGNNDYDLILPGYVANIPKPANNDNIGVEPSEIGRLQNDDEVIRQACLQF
ncbi:unnamed protein product [Rotaria magnacalcarata]|uniref:Uncharacterized protein n=2 Tax=Rotaria magnacalcarata TaxID=392030 RepID=A0A815A6Z1_9BILA|nr:unnamed protein product [Rotaria magnacalcarata]